VSRVKRRRQCCRLRVVEGGPANSAVRRFRLEAAADRALETGEAVGVDGIVVIADTQMGELIAGLGGADIVAMAPRLRRDSDGRIVYLFREPAEWPPPEAL
jgi:hypothetical protein